MVTSSEDQVPVSNASNSSKRILLGPALAKPEEFHSRLGKMLIDRDLVTHDELGRALERQAETGERLGEALVALGAVSSTDVAGFLPSNCASRSSIFGTMDSIRSSSD